MRTIYPSGYEKPDWPVLAEARTPDQDKLLFQVADNGTEPLLLIKPKGIRTVYGLPMSALIALCCLPINPTETDKT